MIKRSLRPIDSRTGLASGLVKMMRYIFPDHWSFLLGEIALYCFIVLVATGVYLTLFFDPSTALTTYHGTYSQLDGVRMSHAYASSLDLSFEVRAGLLIRQTHHWAALVFIAAILLHMMRIFFTGAFRKPRELNYVIGLTLLSLAILEGFAGYSLPDDLASGMGLAIANAVALSIPIVGSHIALAVWGAPFPGTEAFESRLYILHVLILPAAIGGLIAIHLTMIALLKHTQFRGPGRREQNVVGSPLWPSYALRSAGLFFAVAGVLVILGGLVQINALWQYGPYQVANGTNGVQPDWYMGWLIGALRLMPPIEPQLFGRTIPNPFFGGALFPMIAFGILYAWPWLERFFSDDYEAHHLLQLPRDNPVRSAFGAALFTWVAVPFFAGSADRVFVTFDVSYSSQVTVLRILWLVLPTVAFMLTLHVCRRLRDSGSHPLRGWTGTVIRRNHAGGFESVERAVTRRESES